MALFPNKVQYNNWSKPSKLTFWSFILGLFGVLLTLFISLINISIFKTLNNNLDYKLVMKCQSIIESIDETTYTGNEFDYWPECGVRNAYYRIASTISYNDLQKLYGGKIFLKGPHFTNNLNLTDRTQFGHYNMKFLNWVDIHITAALEDSGFIQRTQEIYDKNLSFIMRHYVITKLYLDKHPYLKQSLLFDYKTHIEDHSLPDTYIQQVTFVKYFSPKFDIDESFLTSLKVNKDSFDLTALHPLIKSKENLRRDERHILAKDKKVRKRLQHLMEFGSSNVIAPAIYFWLRRNIGGTEEKIFSIVKKVILKYDAANYHSYSGMILYE